MPTPLTIITFDAAASRGGAFHIRIGRDSSDTRSATAELLLIERKVGVVLNVKRNNSRSVSSIVIEPGVHEAAVPVPIDAPDTYTGETIGWDYELRLSAHRVGADDTFVTPVVVRGDAETSARHPAATTAIGTQQFSRPSLLAGTLNPDAATNAILIIGLSACAAFLTWLALAKGLYFLLAFSGFLALMVVVLVVYLIRGGYPVNKVTWTVPDEPITLGTAATVAVDRVGHPQLELGLRATEICVLPNGRTNEGVSKLLVERWVPVVSDILEIPILPTDVVSYPGEEVAVLWVMVLRLASAPEAKRRWREQHVKPIRVVN